MINKVLKNILAQAQTNVITEYDLENERERTIASGETDREKD